MSVMPARAMTFDGRKFMWDGRTCETEAQAREAAASYEKDRFETRLHSEGGVYLVYTRRQVTEVTVEGGQPV